MPPKKRTTKSKIANASSKHVEPSAVEAPNDPPEEVHAEVNGDRKSKQDAKAEHDKKSASKKRKNESETDEPQKAPRRSGRGTQKSQPSQEQLLKYMLSQDAEELCRPEDETEDIKQRGDIKTYSSSVLRPFEELLCAVVLSRPISHRLGLRTIRTILNPPYNFTSAKATKEAGSEKHHQAVWDARTQHKDKTAQEIGHLADVALEKFTSKDDADGTGLQKVRDECGEDVSKQREFLKSSVKGLAKTGLDIFFRRVQWLWDEEYPFIDDRTSQALRKLGLPEDSDDLLQVIKQHWPKLNTKHLAGDDEATKKRRAFVIVLERATGSDLESKQDALLEAAAAL